MPASIESLIIVLRGQRVILDKDLADIYGVPTKAFNQAVKRNAERFPADFMFRLTEAEHDSLRSQIVTLDNGLVEEGVMDVYPQKSDRESGRGQHRKYLPYAFTEHGAIMASMVLNSPEAVRMSVYVVRAFTHMREQIAANAAVLQRLAEIDRTLLEHDGALRDLWAQLEPLLAPPPEEDRKSRIGFKAESGG